MLTFYKNLLPCWLMMTIGFVCYVLIPHYKRYKEIDVPPSIRPPQCVLYSRNYNYIISMNEDHRLMIQNSSDQTECNFLLEDLPEKVRQLRSQQKRCGILTVVAKNLEWKYVRELFHAQRVDGSEWYRVNILTCTVSQPYFQS